MPKPTAQCHSMPKPTACLPKAAHRAASSRAFAASTMVSAQLSGACPSSRRASIAALALLSFSTSGLRSRFSGRSSSSLHARRQAGGQAGGQRWSLTVAVCAHAVAREARCAAGMAGWQMVVQATGNCSGHRADCCGSAHGSTTEPSAPPVLVAWSYVPASFSSRRTQEEASALVRTFFSSSWARFCGAQRAAAHRMGRSNTPAPVPCAQAGMQCYAGWLASLGCCEQH